MGDAMRSALGVSGWLLMAVLTMLMAVSEVTWMASRVSAHRAARAMHHAHHGPGKIIYLPLTGLK